MISEPQNSSHCKWWMNVTTGFIISHNVIWYLAWQFIHQSKTTFSDISLCYYFNNSICIWNIPLNDVYTISRSSLSFGFNFILATYMVVSNSPPGSRTAPMFPSSCTASSCVCLKELIWPQYFLLFAPSFRLNCNIKWRCRLDKCQSSS